jgi:hypothetical protein
MVNKLRGVQMKGLSVRKQTYDAVEGKQWSWIAKERQTRDSPMWRPQRATILSLGMVSMIREIQPPASSLLLGRCLLLGE